MGYAVNSLKPLYQIPIEKTKIKPFERTWYGRELVDLFNNQADRPKGVHKFGKAPASASSGRIRKSSTASSPTGLPLDPGLVSEEYYVRRVGFDKFLLLHGEYFNLNAEIPANWYDLRSLISYVA